MRCNAIGFVEVVGLVAAIEAGDAMAKAAQIRLLKYHHITPGLVTVVVEGDLASCRAAVDAGVAAAARVGQVVSSLVLGRPDRDTEALILDLLEPDCDDRAPPVSSRRQAAQSGLPVAKAPPMAGPVAESAGESSPEVLASAESVPEPVQASELDQAAELSRPETLEQAVDLSAGVPEVMSVAEALSAPPELPVATPAVATSSVDLPPPETLLAYVSAAARGRTCQEVARRFQVPPAKARDILDQWVAEGHLEKNGSRYLLPHSLF